ncbi:sideroflexin-4 isoform X2 [Bombina bombina]|uniref:sideroflexin-4 isoform X2 n=1 Tax=Bombina bombina TaxID=8345 RepID=UPI00235AC432|nr:sideroflexin-4 isoform X2 [Bombina bombina]
MSLRGQEELPTFFGRFIHWINVLDPTTFLASDAEIENSKNLLEHSGHSTKDSLEGEKVKEALKVCEASLHPDTGNIIPPIFRPPAFMPLATPLVVAALLPHKGTKSAFFWQILFQSYNAGFTLLNGRNTNNMEHVTSQQSLLLVGAVSYAACVGASPYFLMNRYKLTSPAMQTFFRKMLPVPVITFLSALNVLFVRMPEIEHGIEVRDKAGNIIGVSHHAGEKAVKETAVSRMALVGVTSLMPMLLHFVFQRFREMT